MNVLSLFDGMSCGQIALNKADIPYSKYYASEIDKYAIQITQKNYPETIQLGDVSKINIESLPKIDLLLGGSPCQGFSNSGKKLNFEDPRSKLFWEYVRIKEELNPKYFLLENVVMKSSWIDIISKALKRQPVLIDSADFSAQRRERLYWTNIPISAWQRKDIKIRDIIEELPDEQYKYMHEGHEFSGKHGRTYYQYDLTGKGHGSQNFRAYYLDGKSCTLSYASQHVKIMIPPGRIRMTTRFEHERLQTVPDGYTDCVSLNKAKQCLGNGWTVDVIAHILSGMK